MIRRASLRRGGAHAIPKAEGASIFSRTRVRRDKKVRGLFGSAQRRDGPSLRHLKHFTSQSVERVAADSVVGSVHPCGAECAGPQRENHRAPATDRKSTRRYPTCRRMGRVQTPIVTYRPKTAARPQTLENKGAVLSTSHYLPLPASRRALASSRLNVQRKSLIVHHHFSQTGDARVPHPAHFFFTPFFSTCQNRSF